MAEKQQPRYHTAAFLQRLCGIMISVRRGSAINKRWDAMPLQDISTSVEKQYVVNVASVPQRSPFRYPGGKTWLVPRIRQWLGSFSVRPADLIEPFAGGGIVSLTAVFENLVERAILVELDHDIASV